jgi:hypothetical protein
LVPAVRLTQEGTPTVLEERAISALLEGRKRQLRTNTRNSMLPSTSKFPFVASWLVLLVFLLKGGLYYMVQNHLGRTALRRDTKEAVRQGISGVLPFDLGTVFSPRFTGRKKVLTVRRSKMDFSRDGQTYPWVQPMCRNYGK